MPMLFHEGPKVGTAQRLQLEIAAKCLATVQRRSPTRGIVWCGTEGKPSKIVLNGAARKTDKLARDLKEALSSDPPRLRLNDHCQICEFRNRCRRGDFERRPQPVRKHRRETNCQLCARGIFTVSQLSYTFRGIEEIWNARQPPPRQHACRPSRFESGRCTFSALEVPHAERKVYFDLERDLPLRLSAWDDRRVEWCGEAVFVLGGCRE